MKLGLIGLGKMGYNLALNLKRKNHHVTAYDISPERVSSIKEQGISIAENLEGLVHSLDRKRVIWLMVPAGKAVDSIIDELIPILDEGDIVIDGGNSFYKDSISRYERLKLKGIRFLDAGVSGGVEGALNGVCVMVGGDIETFHMVEGLFRDISIENGYLYTGKAGSGHFVKMAHNGIEYGMLQAMGEGFELLDSSGFDLNYKEIANLWNNGSVIRGWLMELAAKAFEKNANLDSIKGVMYSSGEGQWAAEAALELKVPAPVIAASVMMRYRSVQEDSFTGKVVAALRNEFGGHNVKSKD